MKQESWWTRRIPASSFAVPDRPNHANPFYVWTRLTIGGYSPRELTEMLAQPGFYIDQHARKMLANEAFTTLPERRTIRLGCCELSALGVIDQATIAQVFGLILRAGGKPAPAEVAPHLRYHFTAQPYNTKMWLAMKPIVDARNRPRVFELSHAHGARRLDGAYASETKKWSHRSQVVFELND